MRWELTATNFFNHPNYNNPATNISQAAAVGVISGCWRGKRRVDRRPAGRQSLPDGPAARMVVA